MDDQGLHYYDYTTIGKKIKAILLPIVTKESLVKYPTIKSISLVVGEGMTVPEGIGPNGPISASFYVVGSMVEHFESPYYLAFKLNNNQEVALDLSKNAKDKTSIKQVISLLETNTNTKVNLVKEKF
ncbi:hypothetical protein IV57_GL002026 [Companilactobacillus kimchiensis]|uniref:Uncharacterized protein n=1 Tax=Companilactobacillus kimchiensis TaxID=993692 RepID=A0A0R2LIT7_9LACO|nr:hypothetical protein IV57_GL002026 [Companilactobacillus kimchiensis]